MVSQHHESDLRSALTGLIVGTVALFLVVFGIVQMVNATQSKKTEAGHVTHQ
jgi:hypothetical protein